MTKQTKGVFAAIMRAGEEGPQILLSERTDGKGWNLPGGRAQEGETPRNALIRRVREETGLEVLPLWHIGGDHLLTENDVTDTAHIIFCMVVGGGLKTTEDAPDHDWFTREGLKDISIVVRPTPDLPGGRTPKMVQDALAAFTRSSYRE